MRKCYYVCTTSKMINYKESDDLCKNRLIGLSHQDEARFSQFIAISNKISLNQTDRILNLNIELEDFPIPTGERLNPNFKVYNYFIKILYEKKLSLTKNMKFS